MAGLPLNGPIRDDDLAIVREGGIVLETGLIQRVGPYDELKETAVSAGARLTEFSGDLVLIPGLIDAHTHMCFAGSRAKDYALRLQGASYLEIARRGGGIMETVKRTRMASLQELTDLLLVRCSRQLADGVTTCEVKSGYGLTVSDELKMLHAIQSANEQHPIDLMPTCLAAHICPPEFNNPLAYIQYLVRELLPEVRKQNLSRRIDIFVEKSAFGEEDARVYFRAALDLGFSLTIHADQFTVGGSGLAAEFGAASADHLEACGAAEIAALVRGGVTGTVLPGATLGLGMQHAPARRMLNAGMCIAIASDWNPGSAPMGDLLVQAALLGIYERLSIAETLAGMTFRAAHALQLTDRGCLAPGNKADLAAFACNDYREIFWQQGKLKPACVWKNGKLRDSNRDN